MGPKIKIYKVPSNFNGINDLTTYQDTSCPDIVFASGLMYPIEEAIDTSNVDEGGLGLFEPSGIYKVELTQKTTTSYYPTQSGIINKAWVQNHITFEPRLFVKKPAIYYNGEVHNYTYIPKYDDEYDINYTIDTSGVNMSSSFMASSSGLLDYGLYAQFYYWESQSYQHPTTSNAKGLFAPASGDYIEFSPIQIDISGGGTWNILPSTSGLFDKDTGVFFWDTAPSGVILRIAGYKHTWERLTNDDLHDMQFYAGEKNPSGISPNKYLVKDFTENGSWYNYSDFKVVNESSTTRLEKVFVQPYLRGKLNAAGNIIEGWGGYTDPYRPWDIHIGQAGETNGYTGLFANNQNVCTIMCWQASHCLASGITASGVDPNSPFRSTWRFPYPLSGADVPQIINFYRSTQLTPDSSYAFSYSRDVISGVAATKWFDQDPQNAEFLILNSGTYSQTGFPIPDTIYGRMLYTLRNFDVPAKNWSSSPQFNTISESDGIKAWTMKVLGTYYE